MSTPSSRRTPRGFTLVELLTVIAIIGILGAILIPTVTVAIKHVRGEKTRFQLNNLVTACTMYHDQYKIWPTLLDSAPNSSDYPLQLDSPNARPRWVHMMNNRPDGSDQRYNRKGIVFYDYSPSDVTDDPSTVTPRDAFGNTDMYLVFNTNLSNVGSIDPKVVNGIVMHTEENPDKDIKIEQDEQRPIQTPCVGLSPGAGSSDLDAITTWNVIAPNGG